MPDAQIPSLALALSGLVLAMKPESLTAALAFIGAAALFGFIKWLDQKKSSFTETKLSSLVLELSEQKKKIDQLMLKSTFSR